MRHLFASDLIGASTENGFGMPSDLLEEAGSAKSGEIMSSVTIDVKRCIGCGLCVDDCPNNCICLEDGKATASGIGCIECGHCYAICPENSVSMMGYKCADEPVVPMTEIDPDTLLAAMRSRRSIRRFSPRPVEAEKLQKILEAGRYCPTGANAQDVSFTILGSRQREAEGICVELFRKGKRLGEPLVKFLKRIEITDDFFFKGAPEVIVVSSKNSLNAGLASSYMELMAYSLGLGVLYSGFFVVCTKLSGTLRKMLQLPKGHEAVSCLVLGYTDIRYLRIAPRKPLQVRTL